MGFLAPGELDRVWLLKYVDWGDFEIIGIYSSELAADTAKLDCQRRAPEDAKRRHSFFFVDEWELDADLKPHYFWED